MLWLGGPSREFYDVGTIGMVSRVTGGQVTSLRGAEAGSAETVEHLREQLAGALMDHAHSGSEAILKVGCRATAVVVWRLFFVSRFWWDVR